MLHSVFLTLCLLCIVLILGSLFEAKFTKELIREETEQNESERLAEIAAEWRGDTSDYLEAAVNDSDLDLSALMSKPEEDLEAVRRQSIAGAVARCEVLGGDPVAKFMSGGAETALDNFLEQQELMRSELDNSDFDLGSTCSSHLESSES